jgi:hypothetical protein
MHRRHQIVDERLGLRLGQLVLRQILGELPQHRLTNLRDVENLHGLKLTHQRRIDHTVGVAISPTKLRSACH